MKQREKTVSREQGLILKRCGFDIPVATYQVDSPMGAIITGNFFNHNFNPERVSLPTYSEVCRWLAESMGIDIVVYPVFDENQREYGFKIYTLVSQNGSDYSDFFDKREDAYEAAISEVINNLKSA